MKQPEITKKGPIGGIKGKVINLILFSVTLLTVAYMILTLVHNGVLSNLISSHSTKQEQSINETTSLIMDEVVSQTLSRSNKMKAKMADEQFDDLTMLCIEYKGQS